MDPGKYGHAWNGIPGNRNSRNRIDDVTSGPPIPHAPPRDICLPDITPTARADATVIPQIHPQAFRGFLPYRPHIDPHNPTDILRKPSTRLLGSC
jgi:hypothetical protein